MKLYFIPVIVFLTSLNNSQNNVNNSPTTVVWVNESVDENEFTVEEILYETSFSVDSSTHSILLYKGGWGFPKKKDR